MLKTLKRCYQIIFRRNDGDVKYGHFAQEFIDLEIAGQYCNKRIKSKFYESLAGASLAGCNKDVTFHRSHNVRQSACHPVNINWSEKFETVTVQRECVQGNQKFYGMTWRVQGCRVQWALFKNIRTRPPTQ